MNPAVSQSSRAASVQAPVPQQVKILAVDDDKDNLFALQAILDPLNQELMLAENGTDALRLCLDHDFAAILLDVRMPGIDGFETAELIRARKRSRHTPILFLTAYRSDEQLFRGYDLGAVDFLFKPIVPEVLQSKVSVFVELSRSEQLLRRQAQELSRAERTFRAVLEGAPDAMVITSASGVIELANTRTDSLFGHPRESLIGCDIRTLIPGWRCPELIDGAPSAASPSIETRMTGIRQNGSLFPAEITCSSFSAPDTVLVTTAIRDATDQVQAENRINRINQELEKRVADRTAELTRSNEALRQFAWAASHDLQEPIRTVLAYSQWLAKSVAGRLDEREETMLKFIEQHGARMYELVSGLQQYIYVSESGQQAWASVNCNEVVKTATFALQGIIDETGALIECQPLPTIDSIELLLVQLFKNLISNGIKYRSEARPHIQVSAEQNSNGWIFSVRDNGIGVEPKYFEYIFGVFRRLHGVEQSGTGIGLAICRAAVDRLGGRIWVESTPGSGSVFHFFHPEASKEVPDRAPEVSHEVQPQKQTA
jgi:PAS domain S-box-containing protein